MCLHSADIICSTIHSRLVCLLLFIHLTMRDIVFVTRAHKKLYEYYHLQKTVSKLYGVTGKSSDDNNVYENI